MRIIQRLREWMTWRRRKREVNWNASVLLAQLTTLEIKLIESKKEFIRSSEKILSEMEKYRGDLLTALAQAKDLGKRQEELEWENTGLRDRNKYVEELLLPAMTQGHSRIIEMLEAETAIQIRRQGMAKGSIE